MPVVRGLVGLRPDPIRAARVTAPPYDVVKKGSALEARLFGDELSLVHVTLGEQPKAALDRLVGEGALVRDDEPAFYVYRQEWPGGERTGVLVACEVSAYEKKNVIRHEKTFDDKVKGRIALAQATGHTMGPVFGLTRSALGAVLDEAKSMPALYDFTTDLGGLNDLHGIHSRIVRVPEASALGQKIAAAIGSQPVYIADGHHRYHAALKNQQSHTLMYVTERAGIQAYDRVVTGTVPFAKAKASLALVPADRFETPKKHVFSIYSREGSFTIAAKDVPKDVVGRLDCSILEREVYPALGLSHAMIADPKHFDYYPESQIDMMQAAVDRGEHELAIALHPVSIEELVAVADAGLTDSNVVMPEKSTFFAPKILSGVFVYRHTTTT